jgi:hypothetical protein
MRTRLILLGVILLWGCGKNAIQPADSDAAGAAGDGGAHDGAADAATGGAGTGGGGSGGGGSGGGGTAGTSAINCATVGCSAPPLCSVGCTATCGCCACGEGERKDDLVCHGGCYAPAGDGGAASAAFTSFRVTSAYGPCPPGGDCSGYIEIDGAGKISRDHTERPDAGVGTAQLSSAELAHAASIVTAPALVKLLDATSPPCAPPTDIFENMKLVDGAGTHENSTTACQNAPIKAARDELTALGNKYLPAPPR